jgi:DUF4097 and DUF4098 domain-containing protein YvlB
MTIAAIQGTLLLYTMEKANITQRLMGIMDNMNVANMNSTELMEQTNEKRAYYSQMAEGDQSYADSTQYEIDSEAVENDYQLQLSQINSWDSQMQQDKNSLETELKIVTSYEESWTTLLKNNIKKDFTYGSSS